MKRYCVAVIKDNRGVIIGLGELHNVNEKELNNLTNELANYHNEEKSKLLYMQKRIDKLELDIKLDHGEISKEEYDLEVEKLK